MSLLYANITNITNPIRITVNENHDVPSATAVVECTGHSLSLGDLITIDAGYTSNHAVLFTGYVKQIDYNVPDKLYTITMQDKMIRAMDYFIAASDPNNPLKFKNVSAESLVQTLMAEAGLTSFTYGGVPTNFLLGVINEFEVNLVSSYDFCRNIADLLSWNLWCSIDGTVNFKNRKPYIMTGTSGQPGDTADTFITYDSSDIQNIEFSYILSNQSLRNRVVVYGVDPIHAEASASSPYLPAGFYKSVVFSHPDLIDTQDTADKTASYNLQLLNRLTEQVQVQVQGEPSIHARTALKFTSAILGASEVEYYIYSCEHMLDQSGYFTNLALRK